MGASSPNTPTRDTAWVYPGMGLLESVNVFEGRGTAKPFQWLGAPWIDEREAYAPADDLNARDLPGVTFRPSFATPTASKHTGAFCGGIEVHVTDPAIFQPVPTGVNVLDALFRNIDEVGWREGAACRTAADACWIDTLSGVGRPVGQTMTRPPGGGRASRPGGHSRPPLRGPVTR